jgi:hypothetical protein
LSTATPTLTKNFFHGTATPTPSSLIEYSNAYAHQTFLLWYGYANNISFEYGNAYARQTFLLWYGYPNTIVSY